jgi:hypothetical protein
VSEIWDAIIEEYDVESKRAKVDILELLQDLLTHKLIEVKDEQGK